MNSRKWREHMKAAAGALLFAAVLAYANDRERRIVTGQLIGDTHTLVAATQSCYCSETCQ